MGLWFTLGAFGVGALLWVAYALIDAFFGEFEWILGAAFLCMFCGLFIGVLSVIDYFGWVDLSGPGPLY
ncbi:hypothetical protein ACIBG7_27255 [Nonomuraea sp. NPDC050328]|uniref:hypothetical protein n=1 Tax=Nonomuraea sp. NPDC050328 TaxID=3364361 RepID=UPI00378AAEAF